ncbi:MAG: IS30 family transposase [Eubacteriales bacterium]|nr:IS30 family transposase [Eubacteriales bacterium]
MRRFSHLSFTDRLKIEKMLKEGRRVQAIADTLHVHNSTIYRELKRGVYTHMNSDLTTDERYSPDKAQAAYEETFSSKGPALKIGNDHNLANYIEYKIVYEHYSPAAVLGEIEAKELTFETTICLHTLYSYIDKGVFLNLTNKNLPQKGKRKTPRSYKHVRPARAPKGDSIELRPDEINERTEFGHWEMDTVYGRKRTKKALLVLTERLSRNEIIIPIKDRTAASVNKAMDGLERRYGARFKRLFKSITIDNGPEFSDRETLERSIHGGQRTRLFYCHPYSSWERGSNENQNGMIRRHHPKGTNFAKVTNKAIAHTETWLNNYPREMFGWRSAADVFQEHVALL